MNQSNFDLELAELSSAEDFLDYLGVGYDPAVVRVNRLHILQRFHNSLAGMEAMPEDDAGRRRVHADLLRKAYEDFVTSDARTEKLFRVFRLHEPHRILIPLADLNQGVISSAPPV